MGKNKKWKRKAKRIKGICTYMENINKDCRYCPLVLDECICILSNTNRIPTFTQIREIERICKYGR